MQPLLFFIIQSARARARCVFNSCVVWQFIETHLNTTWYTIDGGAITRPGERPRAGGSQALEENKCEHFLFSMLSDPINAMEI